MQYKKNADLILYPEISVEIKLPKGDTSVWPSNCQTWAIHKVRFTVHKFYFILDITRRYSIYYVLYLLEDE